MCTSDILGSTNSYLVSLIFVIAAAWDLRNLCVNEKCVTRAGDDECYNVEDMEIDRPSHSIRYCVWLMINPYLRMSCPAIKSYREVGLLKVRRCTNGMSLVLQNSWKEIFVAIEYSVEEYVPWVVVTIWPAQESTFLVDEIARVLIEAVVLPESNRQRPKHYW